jgi:hypothetical protein
MKSTKLTFRLLASFGLLSVLAATSGCFLVVVGAAGAAGAGTVAFVRGELDTTYGKPFESVVAATENAVAQLQFAKVSEAKDALTAEIISRTAEDKKIDIKIVKRPDGLTNLGIRVGVFGDEQLSRIVLDKINANL